MYMSKLFDIGYTKPIELEDLGGVSKADRADLLYAEFMIHFSKEASKPKKQRSLWGVLWRTVRYWKLFFALFLFGVSAALQ